MLTWRDGDGGLEILVLRPDQFYLIGRLPTMSVVIAWDTKVSKLHAELNCKGGEWVIADDGLLSNGTWINGKRIAQSTRLRDKDIVRVGVTLLAFHAATSRKDITTTAIGDRDDGLTAFDDVDRAVLVELCRDYVEHSRPNAVESSKIAAPLNLTVWAVKKRLGKMYQACDLDGLPRGAKRAELMALVVRHGFISRSDYRPRAQEQP